MSGHSLGADVVRPQLRALMENARQFMSIRHGLLRLWSAVSVLWVAVIGTLVGWPILSSYEWLQSDACKAATSENKAKGLLSDADFGLCDTPKDAIISGASTLLAPPSALLAVGLFAGWVVAGFKTSST